MLTKLPAAEVGLIADWLHRRAERRAQLNATEELSQSRDDILGDIGISRDDIEHAFRSHGGVSLEMPHQHGGEQ